MDKKNKIIIGIITFFFGALVIYEIIWASGKNKTIASLNKEIDANYKVRVKELNDSVVFWHNEATVAKVVADSAVKYASSLEKIDSIRHIKITKKINEIPKYNYSQSDHLSDSLLRAAGVK